MATVPVLSIEALERDILTDEGSHHVEGHYYADLFDAERQRHRAAERLHRTLERLASRGAITLAHAERAAEVAALYRSGETACAWCEHAIAPEEPVVPVGGRLVHVAGCLEEFDSLVAGGAR